MPYSLLAQIAYPNTFYVSLPEPSPLSSLKLLPGLIVSLRDNLKNYLQLFRIFQRCIANL